MSELEKELKEVLEKADSLLTKFLVVVHTKAIEDYLPFGLKDEVIAAVARDGLGINAILFKAESQQKRGEG